jgi:drug/metabolite transporter (DMT)-like permease
MEVEIKKKSARLLDVRDVLIVGGYVVWESVNVICIARAKDPVTNQAPYSSATVVLVAECIKFSISTRQLWKAGLGTADIDWQDNWKFLIPALLYCINNNLFIFALRLVPGSVFQMLLNLRSLYTGVLFYFLMGRQLSARQWSSLIILCFGTVLCQYATMEDTGSMIVSQWGVMLSFIYGFISVAAGVWTELLLKKGTKSIHLDNAQLYFYGIWFNLGGLLMSEWGTEVEGGGGMTPAGVFRGWELASTWTICFNIAGGFTSRKVLAY